jgi:hypothetical protein
MSLEGKFIWIWEVNRCDNGNIQTLIQNAKNIGVDGYIIKTHDGSNFWYQSHVIPELKSAGLKIGAWGYCYGNNISGEISAIKKSITFQPDFYVMDVEAEFESQSKRNVAEQMLIQLKDIGVPLGYTSFAIPSYHTIPFDIFSKYCNFTMPQIYWALMKWQVSKAFQTSYDEYSKYNLPIYPIGQITSDVLSQDIIDFNALCKQKNISMLSYWDFQDAGSIQFNTIKQITDQEFRDAVNVLQNKGIINSPQYWIDNAMFGKTINGEYARLLVLRMANKLI